MTSRNGCYEKSPDVRTRVFEEWGRIYAYSAEDAETYDLNASAALILELCDGRPYGQIEADYVAIVAPKVGEQEARRQFGTGFDALMAHNIVSARE